MWKKNFVEEIQSYILTIQSISSRHFIKLIYSIEVETVYPSHLSIHLPQSDLSIILSLDNVFFHPSPLNPSRILQESLKKS